MAKRISHQASFKGRVALEALKEGKTLYQTWPNNSKYTQHKSPSGKAKQFKASRDCLKIGVKKNRFQI